jgi:hypothetical protein
MRKLILLFLCLSLPVFGAVSSTVQWDVRTTGSDSNSGGFDPGVSVPGTDYSQQNSPQITYTDLVIGVTTTQYTSVLHVVSSALPGNTLLVTGGTGCWTGTFEILSNATITATVDRSLGTAASVCTAVLGGGFLTIPHALSTLSNASGSFTPLNQVWVKSGTYAPPSAGIGNCTNQSSCSGSVIPGLIVQGYGTTHGDITSPCSVATTCPLIATANAATPIWSPVGSSVTAGLILKNLEMAITATSNPYSIIGGPGGPDLTCINCKFDVTSTAGGSNGIYNSNYYAYILLWGSEFNVSSGNYGINDVSEVSNEHGQGIWSYYSYYHGAGTGFWDGNSAGHQLWHLYFNAFSGMARGVYAQTNVDLSLLGLDLVGNAFYNMTNEAVRSNGVAVHWAYIFNNIFYGGTYGVYIFGYVGNGSGTPWGQPLSVSNAYGNQGTAPYLVYPTQNSASNSSLGGITPGLYNSDIALGACQPFNAPASADFSLSTCGKAALGAKGFPGVTPAGTGYLDIGALQSQAAAGASIAAGSYVQ